MGSSGDYAKQVTRGFGHGNLNVFFLRLEADLPISIVGSPGFRRRPNTHFRRSAISE
jgi:hypothetical protein